MYLILIICALCKSCFGEKVEKIKMKKSYDNEIELQADIIKVINNQYGMEFEIGNGLDGGEPGISIEKNKPQFYGYLRPAGINDIEKELNIYCYFTSFNNRNNIINFCTQAHVYMFESQLREDVSKIMKETGVKYDILDFRGMDRDVYKWSKNSSYKVYKDTKDYETWIYIKIDKEIEEKDYPAYILPKLKKIYTALEPSYNPVVLFYVDHYHNEFYDPYEKRNHITDYDNCAVIWLYLSKYNNINEWTEHDIEIELNMTGEDLYITNWKKAHGIN